MVRWCYVLTIALGLTSEVMAQDFWSRRVIRACCSQADAVFSDRWRFSGNVAIVTVTHVGKQSSWASDQIGKTYRIPKSYFRWEPNPTGSAILFIQPHNKLPDGTYAVYCFVPGALS